MTQETDMPTLHLVAGPSRDAVDNEMFQFLPEFTAGKKGLALGTRRFEFSAAAHADSAETIIGLKSSTTIDNDEREVFSRLFPENRDYFICQELSEGYRIAGLGLEPIIGLWHDEMVPVIVGIDAGTVEQACSIIRWYGGEVFTGKPLPTNSIQAIRFSFDGHDALPALIDMLRAPSAA